MPTNTDAYTPSSSLSLHKKSPRAIVQFERGILAGYMHDESSRKKVFATAARFPCDKNDLGEALAQNIIRNKPPESARQAEGEFRQAGLDPDNPKVGARFIEWMNANC